MQTQYLKSSRNDLILGSSAQVAKLYEVSCQAVVAGAASSRSQSLTLLAPVDSSGSCSHSHLADGETSSTAI